MSKEDILGGIKNAVSRGWTLKDAMQSFYNAGYPKEEIDQAAREFLSQNSPNNKPVQNQQTQPQKQIQPQQIIPSPPQPSVKPFIPQQTFSSMQSAQSNQPIQSNQTNTPMQTQKPEIQQSNGKFGWIVFLIILLVALIGLAVVLFIFKDRIIELINSSA